MFRPELVLSLLKPIYGRVEALQVCLILAHQVFDLLQEFFRGQVAECHVACEYTPAANSKVGHLLLRASAYWRSLPAKSRGLQTR
jgi:hypothetical protein